MSVSKYFEENRGLLYEIRDLSRGGMEYASNVVVNGGLNPDYCRAMFCVLRRNADSLLKLFDALERIPGMDNLSERISS